MITYYTIAFMISGIITFFFVIGVIIGIGEAINSEDFRDSLNRVEDGYYDLYDKYDVDHYLDDFYYDYDFNL